MQRKEVQFILEGLDKENKKRKLHISLNNRRFYNGFVCDLSDENIVVFLDDKLGKVTILYSQILNIEPMISK